MKLNTIITGCALAAGLMASAFQIQAGVVIDNSLYVPLDFKVKFTYAQNTVVSGVSSAVVSTTKAKLVSSTLTSSDLLNYLGFPKGTVLVTDWEDVYAVNPKTQTILEDLTSNGYVYLDWSDYTWDESYGPKGAYRYVESGTLDLEVYSDSYYSEGDNYFWFDVSGTYNYKELESAVNSKTGTRTVTETLNSSNLGGYGYDYDFIDYDVPVSGSMSLSGSGTITELL